MGCKKLIKILLNLLLSISTPFNSFGQATGFSDEEKMVLQVIQSDSLIVVTNFHNPYSDMRYVKGLGEVFVHEIGYVFYVKNGKSYSRQVINHSHLDSGRTKILVSKVIELEDRDLFDFVKLNHISIKEERLQPFIFKLYDSTSKTIFYDVFRYSHPYGKTVMIYFKGQYFHAYINEFDLELKDIHQDIKNLNFEFNNQTKRKDLYEKSVKLINKLESQYEY